MAQFKDFYIAIGQPGAYSANMQYGSTIGLYATYGIMVKHAPFNASKKIKNPVVQTWKDEEGDDVYLPMSANGDPATVHESADYVVQFVIHHSNTVNGTQIDDYANQKIDDLLSAIRGRWLKIYDTYTGIGFDGVYLQNQGDDPKFVRRKHDTVIFELSFKVNGTRLTTPLTDEGEESSSSN